MTEQGIIEESNSMQSSPVVLGTKKGGSLRFSIGCRKLKDIVKKDSYCLLKIVDTLTTLSRSTWFSTLDQKSGYWQVKIHPYYKENTVVTRKLEYFQNGILLRYVLEYLAHCIRTGKFTNTRLSSFSINRQKQR